MGSLLASYFKIILSIPFFRQKYFVKSIILDDYVKIKGL